MDDEEYVRELFAILANPSPAGIDPADPYGRADDRIDRYDGFGRDLRVTSARVVPSEHGAMVEIGFVLDLPDAPDWAGLPSKRSIQLPVAAEWREASNYDDPADYAPLVARRVMGSIQGYLSARRPGAAPPSEPAAPGAHWAVLVDHLGHDGTVRETSPGRIDVTLRPSDGEPGSLTVLITPDQWELVMHRHVGPVPSDYFGDLLGPRETDELFLVFWDGDLQRSVREARPPVRPWRPVQFVPGGYWTAHRPAAPRGE